MKLIRNFFKRKRTAHQLEIDPDEIFLDSTNLPGFDTNQFEGRLESPITRRALFLLGMFFLLVALSFASKLWILQVRDGVAYAEQSEQNRYKYAHIFSDRGTIEDRNAIPLAWNDLNSQAEFSQRRYTPLPGFGHVLGYVNYPKKDTSGVYFQTELIGTAGIEGVHDAILKGKNGVRMTEIDALGTVVSASITEPPEQGDMVVLSIDARVQEKLHSTIAKSAADYGFQGGAGVIIDVETGEILAMTSFPEFSPEVMTNGTTNAKQSELAKGGTPFLNRVISGQFAPGSIVKPFMAVAALEEKIISPEKEILSTGALKLPNPYFPGQYTVFGDWKAHGWVDMRRALAVSSDVYFYVLGGGFGDQEGLGIARIDKYMKLFGFGQPTGINLESEKVGLVPTPEWKQEVFGERWLIGNTYHTSIGQYGFQVTPLQAVRAIAAVANGGKLVHPTLISNDQSNPAAVPIGLDDDNLQIAREGMRMAVTEGTAAGMNIPAVKVAAKTGTAELGITKLQVNSWTIGFFPYEKPKYAFAVVMERGSRTNLVGATYVFRQVLDWMTIHAPEYLE